MLSLEGQHYLHYLHKHKCHLFPISFRQFIFISVYLCSRNVSPIAAALARSGALVNEKASSELLGNQGWALGGLLSMNNASLWRVAGCDLKREVGFIGSHVCWIGAARVEAGTAGSLV